MKLNKILTLAAIVSHLSNTLRTHSPYQWTLAFTSPEHLKFQHLLPAPRPACPLATAPARLLFSAVPPGWATTSCVC